MHPIPCNHCGNNFMRPTLDPEAPRLCNNCTIREEKRNPKKAETMSTVDILIKCSREEQIEIEEICINQGIDFSRYFLELHHGSQAVIEAARECKGGDIPEGEEPMNHEPIREVKNKGKKK